MTLLSFYILDGDGTVLLSKYFTGTHNAIELSKFERSLHRALLFHEAPLDQKQSFSINSINIAFQKINELIIILCGCDDNDEYILTILLNVVYHIILENSDNKLTSKNILESENYSKIMMALEEFAVDGIIESTNAEIINKLSKMKN